MDSALRTKLRTEVMSSYWEDLAPHQARGALLLLAPQLDLLDAAEAMAGDDTVQLGAWLRSGLMRRASPTDAAQLESAEDQRFQFVVVQPWVLAQHCPSGDDKINTPSGHVGRPVASKG